MQLSELDEHILAYFIAKNAGELQMDPRWWPSIELSSIVEDKVRFAVSRFWLVGRPPVEAAARVLLDTLVARGAFAKKDGEYGPMFQFQRDPYRAWLAEAREINPIVTHMADADEDAWEETFDRLTA